MKVDGEEYTTESGIHVEFYYDEYRDDNGPRDWDNLGTMICDHPNYNLGDEQVKEGIFGALRHIFSEASNHTPTCKTCGDEIEADYGEFVHVYEGETNCEDLIPDTSGFVILPLYLYDHSGISMSTGEFSCPWDSGQVGIIYYDLANVVKDFGEVVDPVARVTESLKSEVKVYDQYLRGDVYGYVIERDHEVGKLDVDDSCWGFYGLDEVKSEAAGILESIEEEAKKYEAESFVILCESIGNSERLDVGHDEGMKELADNWVQDLDKATELVQSLKKDGLPVFFNEDVPNYIQRYSIGE